MPKISELNSITSLYDTDLLAVAHDINGNPSTKKITISDFASGISTAVANAIPFANTTTPGVLLIGENLSANSTGYINAPLTSLPTANTYEGYLLTWDDVGENPIWQPYAPVYGYKRVFNTDTYYVQKHDAVILTDLAVIGANTTVVLPIDGVPVGKQYIIKNMYKQHNFKLTITTELGYVFGESLLEDTNTGNLVVYQDILGEDGVTYIYDGTRWRAVDQFSKTPNFTTSIDTYSQVTVQNRSSSSNSSSDFVVYNDQGSVVNGIGPFIDLGINSTNYTDETYGNVWGPSDSYLYNTGGDMVIGPQTNHTIKFVAGNTNVSNIKLNINSTAIFANTNFIPEIDGQYSLGSQDKQWNDLWVSNDTIYIGGIPVTVDGSGQLTVNGLVSGGYTGSIGSSGYTGSIGTSGYTGSIGSSIKTITTVSAIGPTVISNNITFADPNATGANVNLTLPSSPTSGSVYTVKNINAGGYVVYVQTDGVDNMETETGSIGSGVYATISASGDYITWVYDNSSTTYRIIG